MLSNFIEVGDKIDLQALDRGGVDRMGIDMQKTYHSSVYEIVSEDTLEIVMPLEQGKLVLLPLDSEYDLVFYANGSLYQCFARVIDRYKSNNVYVLQMELTGNLRKYQRREYYRFSCAVDMRVRALQEDEVQNIESCSAAELKKGLPLERSVIVDLSGGGIRFLSDQKYEADSYLYCCYHLLKGTVRKKYELIGKVLSVKQLEKRIETYEHRVQYHNIDTETREEIIRFIFEEERKSRKKGKRL